MKKALLALAIASIIGLGGSELFAWGGGPGWGGRGYCDVPGYGRGYGYRGGGFHGMHNLEFLKEEIGLTESQIKKIITIDSEYRLKYFENRDSYSKINALRDEHRKAIDNVLTDEQKKKLDEYFNDRGSDRYYHRGPGPRW